MKNRPPDCASTCFTRGVWEVSVLGRGFVQSDGINSGFFGRQWHKCDILPLFCARSK